MDNFQFQSILRNQEIAFEQKLFIWIWHADKIPPHVGISLNDAYFSLKVSGKDTSINSQKTLSLAKQKKIALVLVELNIDLNQEKLLQEFNKFERAESGISTCLTPIANALDKTQAQKLSELLTLCSAEINQVYGFHLPENFNGLRNYSVADIQNRLQLLQHDQRKVHIS